MCDIWPEPRDIARNAGDVPIGAGGLGRRAHWSCHSNGVRLRRVFGDVDTVSKRQKGVETLYQDTISVEKLRNALDHARGVDAAERLAGYVISIAQHAHLTLKVLHYI